MASYQRMFNSYCTRRTCTYYNHINTELIGLRGVVVLLLSVIGIGLMSGHQKGADLSIFAGYFGYEYGANDDAVQQQQPQQQQQQQQQQQRARTAKQKAAAIKSNKARKGRKKNSYTAKQKLDICVYYKEKGGSYADLAACKQFARLHLTPTTVADILKNASVWTQMVRDGNGDKRKAHKGRKLKYGHLDKQLLAEHTRRNKLSMDVSRDWMKKRAAEMRHEHQLTGKIRPKPYKNADEWTPHELHKEERYEKKLKERIKKALDEKKIKKFPGMLSNTCAL